MRKVAVLLLMLIALKGICQSTSPTVESNWKIGLQFSTDLNLLPDHIGISTGYTRGYGDLKPELLNYTTGITIQIAINQRWQLLSGFMYSDKDIVGTLVCDVCDVVANSSHFKLRYIEMPVLTRYALTTKKTTMFTEFGFNTSYKIKSPEDPFLSEDQFNVFLLSGQVGLGGSIYLGKRFDLNITGSYRRSFTNFLDDQDFKLKSLSLTTGLYYHL